ncbi:MMPL family transporter [Actinocorallia libanotica]|uniref:MMPL family transporter n=1 Tax=Actinocorallia libanotica TaxID=46162 RepID=A0ABN1Q9D1_9ACTN
MYGWGRFVHRFRWLVLLFATLLTVGAGYAGLGVFQPGVLKQGGFEDPHADSTYAYQQAAEAFGSGSPDVMLVYRSDEHKVTDPEFMQSVLFTVARLPEKHVEKVFTYWHIAGKTKEARDGRKNMISHDGHSTFVALFVQSDPDPTKADQVKAQNFEAIKGLVQAPGTTVKITGGIPIGTDFVTQMSSDILHAEIISAPLVLIIGLIVFGSVAAAVQPILVGVFSAVGALGVLRLITLVTDVSNLAISLVSLLSVGLAIDYSLFVISRFREELAKGRDPRTAMGVTMATGGRTIMFSAVTVAVSMAGLLLFPQVFLKSIGLVGIAVIFVAMLSTIVILPAMLSILGPRIEFGQMPWRKRAKKKAKPEEEGMWYRLAHSVMKRPIIYFLATSAVLILLVLPFARVNFGVSDLRSLPAEMESRQAAELIQTDFSSGVMDPINVLLEGPLIPKNYKPGNALPQNLAKFRDKVAELPGVVAASYNNTNPDVGIVQLQVSYEGETHSEETKELVRKLRAMDEPGQLPDAVNHISVGGSTAGQMDLMKSLGEALPKTGLFVVTAIFLLLFAAFGSIALPIKAIIMNLLSIGSSFGAMVWAFQDGHLSGLLGFTVTGSIDATAMILVLSIIFGLSMDYEVFLLSRIREEWDNTHDNRAAVARGLQQTGGIITSAAVLLIVVVAAFSTAKITTVQVLGVGLLVAVVVDATLVRSLLVPATMRFLGDANWWLPGPLKALHAAIDLREVHDIDLGGAGEKQSAPGKGRAVTRDTSGALNEEGPGGFRRAVVQANGGYAWAGETRSGTSGHPVRKREIVANPDGAGWRWREVEDEYAH